MKFKSCLKLWFFFYIRPSFRTGYLVVKRQFPSKNCCCLYLTFHHSSCTSFNKMHLAISFRVLHFIESLGLFKKINVDYFCTQVDLKLQMRMLVIMVMVVICSGFTYG